MANKLLTGIFLLLLFVIIIEFGYLFIRPLQSVNSFPTPSVAPTVTNVPRRTNYEQAYVMDQHEIIRLGQLADAKVLKNFTWSETFQSTLISASTSAGIKAYPNAPAVAPWQYEATIFLKINDKETFGIGFSKSDLSKLKITKMSKGVETPINITDLIPGKEVIVTLNIDNLKGPSNNLSSGSIQELD